MNIKDVPNNTDVIIQGTKLHFDYMDGAFARCKDRNEAVFYFASWVEAEICEEEDEAV